MNRKRTCTPKSSTTFLSNVRGKPESAFARRLRLRRDPSAEIQPPTVIVEPATAAPPTVIVQPATVAAPTVTVQTPPEAKWAKWTALATVALILTSSLQWEAMRRAGHQTDRAIDLAREERRAWLGVRDVAVEKFAAGDVLRIIAPAHNSGSTPATVTSWSSFITVLPPSRDIGPEFANVKPEDLRQNVVAPGNTYAMHVAGTTTITPEIRDGVNAGRGILYFIGRISYTDILGEERLTQFCFNYIPMGETMRACSAHAVMN
jgi:hypothetical protein